jgi:hypothetical protein
VAKGKEDLDLNDLVRRTLKRTREKVGLPVTPWDFGSGVSM